MKIWSVVHLKSGEEAPPPRARVDACLLDSYSADSPGGTGLVCDWNRAAEWVARASGPVLLAGGLTPDNVAEAIRRVKPWGVDVSSGVEKAPGEKDIQKVKRFIDLCRST